MVSLHGKIRVKVSNLFCISNSRCSSRRHRGNVPYVLAASVHTIIAGVDPCSAAAVVKVTLMCLTMEDLPFYQKEQRLG